MLKTKFKPYNLLLHNSEDEPVPVKPLIITQNTILFCIKIGG